MRELKPSEVDSVAGGFCCIIGIVVVTITIRLTINFIKNIVNPPIIIEPPIVDPQ